MTQRCKKRQGTALITVMIVLLIVTMLLLGSAHTFATAARHQRAADRQLQARWLATTALSRAAAQLQRDPNYQGETWHLSSAQFVGETVKPESDRQVPPTTGAAITIEVEHGESGAQIEATALFPADAAVPVRVVKRITFRP